MKFFWRKKLFLMMLIALFLCISGTPPAEAYNRIIAFGDSLTDGNDDRGMYALFPTTAPDSSTNGGVNGMELGGGNVWIDYLAANLGVTLENYALGGAMVQFNTSTYGDTPAFPTPWVPPFPLGLEGQVQEYLNTLPSIDNGDLVVVWIGGNDAFFWLQHHAIPYPFPDPFPADDIANYPLNPEEAFIPAAMAKIEAQLELLYTSGATHFLVNNLPNLGTTPLGMQIDAGIGIDSSENLSIEWNAALAEMLDDFEDGKDVVVYRYDVFYCYAGDHHRCHIP